MTENLKRCLLCQGPVKSNALTVWCVTKGCDLFVRPLIRTKLPSTVTRPNPGRYACSKCGHDNRELPAPPGPFLPCAGSYLGCGECKWDGDCPQQRVCNDCSNKPGPDCDSCEKLEVANALATEPDAS